MANRAKLYKSMLDTGGLKPIDRVRKWFEIVGTEGYDGHDARLPKVMTLESAETSPTKDNPHHSTTVFSMIVPKEFCNMSGNLHGGAVALIFDITTSCAITAVSREGFWDTGHVSRTLNCTYLRPAPEGAKITIESEVVHLGKRMGLTRGVIKTEDGKVCYTCEHGKASVGQSSM